jgi:uncharacterized damage-inducible protein DinB
MRRTCLLSTVVLALVLALPTDMVAQAASAPPSLLEATRESFVEVAGWIVRAAEIVPEAQYGYRPTDAVRTFGQLVGHVADANNYYCARALVANHGHASLHYGNMVTYLRMLGITPPSS